MGDEPSRRLPYNEGMKVTAVLFAGLKDAIGEERLELNLADGADVAALWSALESTHAGAESYRDRVAFALGDRLATADTPLEDGNEVAILPPISGG